MIVKAAKLEQDLIAVEASVISLAQVVESDYARWICGQNPSDTTELKCFHHSCKSSLQNPQCSSDVKSAFGGCTEGLDHVVVGFEETTVLFADANSVGSKEVSEDVFWTSGVT